MSSKARIVKGKEVVARSRVTVADAVSVVTRSEVRKLRSSYAGFHIRVPKETERAHDFMEGEVCIYLRHLRDGMRLPLQSCYKDFFKFFGLVPAQISPNAMVYIRGLKRMLTKHLEWNMDNFMSLVRVSSNEPGIYHLKPANAAAFGLKGTPDSVHGWKERFVFVKMEDGDWGFPTIPRITKGPVRGSWPNSTEQVNGLYTKLECQYFYFDVAKGQIITHEEAPALSKKRAAEEVAAAHTPPPRKKAKSTKVEKSLGHHPKSPTAAVEPESSSAEEDSGEESDSEETHSVGEEEEEEDAGTASIDEACSNATERNEDADTPVDIGVNEGGKDIIDVGDNEGEEEEEEEDGGQGAQRGDGDDGGDGLHSWCKTKRDVCSFSLGRDTGILPESAINEIFHEVLSSMVLPKDRAAMDRLSPREVLNLQNQLAVQSAVVAIHAADISYEMGLGLSSRLSDRSAAISEADARARKAEEELKKMGEDLEKKEEEMKKEVKGAQTKATNLQTQIDELKEQAIVDRASMLTASTEHNAALKKREVEIAKVTTEKEAVEKRCATLEKEVVEKRDFLKEMANNFNRARKNQETEIAKLKAELEEGGKKATEAETAAATEIETLKKRVAELQSSTVPVPSETDAIEVFKASEEFDILKTELGGLGFDLLKGELIDRGLLTKEVLEPIDFLETAMKLGGEDEDGAE